MMNSKSITIFIFAIYTTILTSPVISFKNRVANFVPFFRGTPNGCFRRYAPLPIMCFIASIIYTIPFGRTLRRTKRSISFYFPRSQKQLFVTNFTIFNYFKLPACIVFAFVKFKKTIFRTKDFITFIFKMAVAPVMKFFITQKTKVYVFLIFKVTRTLDRTKTMLKVFQASTKISFDLFIAVVALYSFKHNYIIA